MTCDQPDSDYNEPLLLDGAGNDPNPSRLMVLGRMAADLW